MHFPRFFTIFIIFHPYSARGYPIHIKYTYQTRPDTKWQTRWHNVTVSITNDISHFHSTSRVFVKYRPCPYPSALLLGKCNFSSTFYVFLAYSKRIWPILASNFFFQLGKKLWGNLLVKKVSTQVYLQFMYMFILGIGHWWVIRIQFSSSASKFRGFIFALFSVEFKYHCKQKNRSSWFIFLILILH